ncbi:MAG: S8 family serine peptidase, partial [candidate division Zixibacteria bacterium]|nr:S8 family serine peptidase [candidate division Zixibacteria bacterium]
MGPCSILTYKLILLLTIFVAAICFVSVSYAENSKYWVYFTAKSDNAIVNISDKALHRRELRGHGSGLTEHDIYPDSSHIQALEEAGITVHNVSRWLNAASVSGDQDSWDRVTNLKFIKKIKPVATFSKDRLSINDIDQIMHKGFFDENQVAFDYGPSFTQLNICQIDSLHSLGFTGEGILIGIMDTGFKIDHPNFADIIASNRLIDTYDFINNDDDVQDTGMQQSHGTATLSIIGGFSEGSLIGSAYGADFILAKTEINSMEIIAEEDNWIAAAEWMEAQGTDIISSSLGYIDWYDLSDLDGNTAAITIAADIAASLGVVVVNSAGNERYNQSWGSITPPADGDSVIAAGGVDSQGLLFSQSSPGPTADGRIKPDVSAMGEGVIAAYYVNDGFRAFNGTSFSAPMIAGGLALILENHPDWSLDTLYDRLRSTATNANAPNNDLGWGIAKFYNMHSGQSSFQIEQEMTVEPNPAVNSVI